MLNFILFTIISKAMISRKLLKEFGIPKFLDAKRSKTFDYLIYLNVITYYHAYTQTSKFTFTIIFSFSTI